MRKPNFGTSTFNIGADEALPGGKARRIAASARKLSGAAAANQEPDADGVRGDLKKLDRGQFDILDRPTGSRYTADSKLQYIYIILHDL